MLRNALHLLASCFVLSNIAFCDTYNAVNDFNLTGVQASGAIWTYGTTPTLNGPFTLLPGFGTVNCTGFATLYPNDCNPSGASWADYFSSGNALGPAVGKNTSLSTITYLAGTNGVGINAAWPNNELLMAPGGSLRGFQPDFVVVRFTNPVAGTYNISGSFSNLQAATVNTYVSILGTPFVESLGSPFDFAGVSLPVGGTVDFIVDSQGEQSFDMVGLSATISTPEPTAGIFLLLAAGCLIILVRRRSAA
jgi:hypothetical protein